MQNGKRHGLGILRTFGGNVKMQADWENDKAIGNVIFKNPCTFTAIVDFKDG